MISDLFRFRQITLCQQLMAKMADLKKKGATDYEINMMGTSNLIQDLAQVYGERRIVDSCIDFLTTIKTPLDRKVMDCVFRVFGLDCIKRDLSFYITEQAISPKAASNMLIAQNSLIKTMSANIEDLLKLLNVPDELLYAPLAQDYV